MTELTATYPLAWPIGTPRTPPSQRRDADFKVDFRQARDEAFRNLRLLGAQRLVLSSSVPSRQDGIPLANAAEPLDPGVAAYFDRTVVVRLPDGTTSRSTRSFVIACDTYRKVRWNLRAVGVTVDALRAIQRHGATSMLEQAFAGFAALPPHVPEKVESWWVTLGVSADSSVEVVKKAYLEIVRTHHPDHGGESTLMAKANDAYSEALKCMTESNIKLQPIGTTEK